MMRVGSIAETSATVSPNAASFSQKLPSHPYPLVLHPGKRNFAPRDFGRDSGLIGPGDRRIAMGDTTSSRQPAELSGFFEPAFVLPVRGDWLVVATVRKNRSACPKLPANREIYREFCKKHVKTTKWAATSAGESMS
jgi:hypothetical protein